MTVLATKEPLTQARPAAAGPRGATPAAGGISGRDFFRILRKRKWLIIINVLAFTVIAIVTTWLWQSYAPLYAAEGWIEIRPPRGNSLANAIMPTREQMEVETTQQARLMTRENILTAAIMHDVEQTIGADGKVISERYRDRIKGTKWYNQDPSTALKRLGKELDSSPLPKSAWVRIRLSAFDPDDAAAIVNAVGDAAIRESTVTLDMERQAEITKISQELKLKEDDIAKDRARRATLVTDGGSSMEARNDEINIKLSSLLPKKAEFMAKQVEADLALQRTRLQNENGQLKSSPEVLQMIEMDGTLRSLQLAAENLNIEQDDLLRRGFGTENPAVKKIESRLKSLNMRIKERTDRVVEMQIQTLLQYREATLAAATDNLKRVQNEIDAVENERRDLATRRAQDNVLKETIERKQKDIDKLQDRQGDLVRSSRIDAPLVWRSQAYRPREISFPQWALMVPLGIALGLLLGLGLAFTLELVDTSIKSPSDISRRVELPLLGMVPHADDLDEEIADLRLAFMTNPASLISESFRQVRTCLMFSGPADQRRSLLVTSPMPEDGRTTVALNMAAAIARGGKRVLVVDANFRQPALKRLFPACSAQGLSSALVGQVQWQEVVTEVDKNLFVIPAGPLPPNPAELLGQMQPMIAEMTSQYDQVIFDGAPCLVVSDSAVLSTLVDGVVLTVRAGANTYGIVQRSRDLLYRVGAHVMGVVLNGVRVTAGGYLRKSYETFYEYHQGPAQLPADTITPPKERVSV